MIKLSCTNCRAALEIDDAFAGSTCRCQFCGTIQTVPGTRRSAAPADAQPKALYARGHRGSAEGSGLDALAEVVASSGLHHQAARATPATPAAVQRENRTLRIILAGAGVLMALLVALVIVLLVNRPESATSSPPGNAGEIQRAVAPDATGPQPAIRPHLLDIDLHEPSVIYVIDRGSAMRESLGPAVAAALRSIRTLGTDRRFQVQFWDNGQEPLAVPPTAAYATRDAISTAERTMQGVIALGRSDASGAFRRAVAARPAVIVLLTSKGLDLDEHFVTTLLSIRGESEIKVHCISIGESESGAALERLARSSGGQFRAVTAAELTQFADD